MKKISIKKLAKEITGLDENCLQWEAELKKVYRIDKIVKNKKCTLNMGEINDSNRDFYVKKCKAIYENPEIYRIMSKDSKVASEKNPYGKKFLTKEEQLKLVDFNMGMAQNEYIKEMFKELKRQIIGKEYEEEIKKLDREIRIIKDCSGAYDYDMRVELIKEVTDILRKKREEIVEEVEANLILPY
ncbi:Uncharacterised protein [Clostridioides difficile]|uniref:hypothetical protein n=1 Tax=Clostridioides difficile TaxID=1496 RepID=UPI0009800CD0|nr:hypothetical protein [Clostridioides difficile]SJS94263.1 Uncharacterised protein [Clostridioides difficile]HBG8471219.1 hypothetical protein [Clostridioides difficile]